MGEHQGAFYGEFRSPQKEFLELNPAPSLQEISVVSLVPGRRGVTDRDVGVTERAVVQMQ